MLISSENTNATGIHSEGQLPETQQLCSSLDAYHVPDQILRCKKPGFKVPQKWTLLHIFLFQEEGPKCQNHKMLPAHSGCASWNSFSLELSGAKKLNSHSLWTECAPDKTLCSRYCFCAFVLISAGIELIFFTVALMLLCFGFVTRRVNTRMF